MTITVAPARNEYTASAGQTIFNFTFKIFDNTDLNVYVTPAGQEANDSTNLTTAYNVSGVGNEGGGSVALSIPTNNGDLVTIVSNVPSSRTIDYQNNGDFRPDTVNADFDRVVSIAKKIEDTANRAVLLQQSQQDPKPLSLPTPEPGKFLVWRLDSSGLENTNIPSVTLPGETVSNVLGLINADIAIGTIVKTNGYYTNNDGGQAEYLIEANQSVDGYGDHLLNNGNVAKLQVSGWVSAKQYGLRGDAATDDSAAEAALSVSPYLFIYFPAGIYRTNMNNGTSNRTYLFEEDAIIDGVIHITGTGSATSPPQASVTWVDNVRILGTATSTIRFGTFYTRKLNVDKIRITEVSGSYLNQTAVGGSTGVHLYFGTKEMECGEIICDSGALNYNLSVDQGPVKGADEVPENIHIGRLVINQTDVTGLVTAETVNLKIDEIIQKNQGGANVAWISTNDKKLKVGNITLNGLGATSGQVGIYLQNTDTESSAEFGTVDVSNVPGIAFRTFNAGSVHINNFVGKNNREHARIQSKVTIDNFEGVDSLEVGLNFFDNFAAGSYVGRANVQGTAGTGINVGSDDVTIDYAKCDGFATLYGLHIPLNTGNFKNSYYEGANCSQGLRILSADEINMGVINLHDNTSGIIGSGLGKFGFDYVYYNNNGTNTNVVLELAAGFRGKKVRASVSADRGNASVSLEVGIDASTQRFTTALTANRTVTFTTTNAQNGDKFRISRTATGAFNLSTAGTFNNKALAANQWADYEFQGAGWYLTGFGTL